jgi:ATP-dependent helicase/nuclease subunit B
VFEPDVPRLFALPHGMDFPRAFVTGFLDRSQTLAPEAVARITIYLNSERMRRSVTDAFVAQGARLLPRLRLVTDPLGDVPVPGLRHPVSALRRQLELLQLVRPLLDRADALSPGATAFAMAESLAELLSEMQTEAVGFDRIRALDVSGQSEHWSKSLTFLSIIDAYLGPDAEPDPASAVRQAVEALGRRWAMDPPVDPVIVAGSTGSRGSTALLMQLVAKLPQGAIVLPGFDFDLPSKVWRSLGDALTAEDHPQYRFRLLCDAMGIEPNAVTGWVDGKPPSPQRNQVVSLALRPAPVTDQWLVEGQDLSPLPGALADVTLIEAASPRCEALAIALILREAAEQGTSAALITPDRMLTRQVTAALDRWGIIPDDSAGRPLGLSAPGRFLQQVAGLMGKPVMFDALLAILKHPLCFTGGDRAYHLLLTRDLELSLRRHGPVFPDGAHIRTWAGARNDIDKALPWAAALATILDRAAMVMTAPMPELVATHLSLTEAFARGEAEAGTGRLWDEETGTQVQAAMAALASDADAGGVLHITEYRDLFSSYIARGEVRESALTHPGIRFLGTIEARVLGAGLVILGGMNEGIWPDQAKPDPWLNRQMRRDAGLLLPERRIGLAAHDFQLAMAAPRVVVSRARRDAEAETVASRWVNRLTTLVGGLPDRDGPQALEEMRARGKVWEERAAQLERPAKPEPPAARPSPRPPLDHRPDRLSLTEIERLIRNPYDIYARKILRLKRLDPMRPEADPRLRGTVLHAVMERFVKERPLGETRAFARQRLQDLTSEILSVNVAWPSARLMWQARMDSALDAFLDFEATEAGLPLGVEVDGDLPLPDLGFHLVGRPDRIDIRPNGKALLIDYKTGSVPTERQQKTYAKQLLLAAVMAEDGAFGQFGPIEVERITYLGLKEGLPSEQTEITPDLLVSTRQGLAQLIGRYARRSQGYTARRAMFEIKEKSDFDALSRHGEWDISIPPDPEDVG